MPPERPSILKALTRLFLPAGCVAVVAALFAVWRLPSLSLKSPGVLAAVICGAAVALLGIALNIRWFWRRITARRTLVSLNVWTQILLAFILLLITNAIVAMTPQTRAWLIDCTYTGRHSISSQTRNILRSLTKPVRITVVMGRGIARYGPGKNEAVNIAQRVADMVELYGGVSKMVASRILDFDRDKDACLRLRNQIEETISPDSIVLQYEDRHEIVPFNVLVQPSDEASSAPVAFNIEAKLTEAIQTVLEESRGTIYVLSGHDEFAVEEIGPRAMSAFMNDLRKNYYRIRTLNLRTAGAVPEDCQTLIIADPTAPISDDELQAITEYADAGGNLFVLLTPRPYGRGGGEIVGMLRDYNVSVQSKYLIWELHESTGRIRQRVDPVVFSNRFSEHPVTEGLKTLFLRADSASPLTTVEEAARQAGIKPPPFTKRYVVTPLASSSQMSWAKPVGTQPTQEEIRGESRAYDFALAVEPSRIITDNTQPGPRIVVCGSANIVIDAVFKTRQNVGNRVFAINAVNWLARKEYKLGIPPQSSDQRMLNLNSAAAARVFHLTVVGLPLLAACVGLFVWWRRRAD